MWHGAQNIVQIFYQTVNPNIVTTMKGKLREIFCGQQFLIFIIIDSLHIIFILFHNNCIFLSASECTYCG